MQQAGEGQRSLPGAEDAVARAHALLLRHRELQFETAVLKPPEIPGWLKALAAFIKAIAPAFPWIFWGCVAVGAVLVLYFVVREALATRWPSLRRRKRAAPVQQPEWRPSEAKARTLLAEADRLAAEGRFADAAHLLLFRSIEDIDEYRPHSVRPALTSRDIGRLEALPTAARPTFAQIAAVVERSFFGGDPVDREAFRACRDAYEAFAFPQVWA